MRLLLDQNLSPQLADGLVAEGHDVVHVRELGLSAASDTAVMDAASADGRVVVSADTDFHPAGLRDGGAEGVEHVGGFGDVSPRSSGRAAALPTAADSCLPLQRSSRPVVGRTRSSNQRYEHQAEQPERERAGERESPCTLGAGVERT